jgi:Holliday junction resolvasome RuvABC DNA-binding subunit
MCTGTPSRGLVFRHADGTPYGGFPTAANTEVRAKTFCALVRMGFRELEAKQALAKIPSEPSATCEALLRAALRDLAANWR